MHTDAQDLSKYEAHKENISADDKTTSENVSRIQNIHDTKKGFRTSATQLPSKTSLKRVLGEKNETASPVPSDENGMTAEEARPSEIFSEEARSIADLQRRVRQFLREELSCLNNSPSPRVLDDVGSLSELLLSDNPREEDGMAPYHPIHAPFSPRPQFMRLRRPRSRATPEDAKPEHQNLFSQPCDYCEHCKKCSSQGERELGKEIDAQGNHETTWAPEIQEQEKSRAVQDISTDCVQEDCASEVSTLHEAASGSEEHGRRRKFAAFSATFAERKRIVFIIACILVLASTGTPTFLPSLYENPLTRFCLETNLSKPAMEVWKGLEGLWKTDAKRMPYPYLKNSRDSKRDGIDRPIVNESAHVCSMDQYLHATTFNFQQFSAVMERQGPKIRKILDAASSYIICKLEKAIRILEEQVTSWNVSKSFATPLTDWVGSICIQMSDEHTSDKREEHCSVDKSDWRWDLSNDYNMDAVNQIFTHSPPSERERVWGNLTDLSNSPLQVLTDLTDSLQDAPAQMEAYVLDYVETSAVVAFENINTAVMACGEEEESQEINPKGNNKQDRYETEETDGKNGIKIYHDFKNLDEGDYLEASWGDDNEAPQRLFPHERTSDVQNVMSSVGISLTCGITDASPVSERFNSPEEEAFAENVESNSGGKCDGQDVKKDTGEFVMPMVKVTEALDDVAPRGYILRSLRLIFWTSMAAAVVGISSCMVWNYITLPFHSICITKSRVSVALRRASMRRRGVSSEEEEVGIIWKNSRSMGAAPIEETEDLSSTPDHGLMQFGSFTDYVESPGSEATKKITPVRRSRRIRSQTFSPSGAMHGRIKLSPG